MEVSGVNLAEMNKLLLQKIEELTLYVIEQKEEAKRQKGKVSSLKSQVISLEEARSRESEARMALEERLDKIEALLLHE